MQEFLQSLKQDGWYRKYLAGNALRFQGRLDEALSQYEQCLEYDDVEEPRVLCTMASVMNEKKDPSNALQVYEHALQLDPEYPESYTGKAYTLLTLGQYELALQQYQKAQELGAKDQNVWIEMGNCLYHLHRVEEALEKYKRALYINPKNFAALHGQGLCFDSIGEHEVAISLFQQAISTNPNYPEAYLSMGVALANLGEHPKAIEAYLKVIELEPSSHEAFNNLGTSYEAVGNIEEALKSFTRATDLRPDYSQVFNNLAVLYRRQENYTTALHCINKAVLIANEEPMYLCNRAIILNKLGSQKQANEDIRLAAKLFKANKTNGLSYTNINFIRQTVEVYAGVLEQIDQNSHYIQQTVSEGQQADKLRTSVNVCLAKNLEQLLEAKSPTQAQLSEMKNEISELKQLMAQLVKENLKMKVMLQDHEARLNNLEKYIAEIVEPIRHKIYPTIEVEKQLTRLKNEENQVYEYAILLHRLFNSYLQSIRLIASGLFQIKNPYESKFVEGLIGQIFKMAGGIPLVGGAIEKIGSLITSVLQYRAYAQFQQTCIKAQHITKNLRTQQDICYAVLREVVFLCQNQLKKSQIMNSLQTIEQRRQSLGKLASIALEVKCKLLKVGASIDKKIRSKVFGLDELSLQECPLLLVLATQDFVVLTEAISNSNIDQVTSLATLFRESLINEEKTESVMINSEIPLKKQIVVSYVYNIQRNQYLSHRGGEFRLVTDPKNASKWQFESIKSELKDVFTISNFETKESLCLNEASLATLKKLDNDDLKQHWRVIRDKKTEGSQFYIQSQHNLKLFLDGSVQKKRRTWLFCSSQSSNQSELLVSTWKSDDSLMWRFQRTKPQ